MSKHVFMIAPTLDSYLTVHALNRNKAICSGYVDGEKLMSAELIATESVIVDSKNKFNQKLFNLIDQTLN